MRHEHAEEEFAGFPDVDGEAAEMEFHGFRRPEPRNAGVLANLRENRGREGSEHAGVGIRHIARDQKAIGGGQECPGHTRD